MEVEFNEKPTTTTVYLKALKVAMIQKRRWALLLMKRKKLMLLSLLQQKLPRNWEENKEVFVWDVNRAPEGSSSLSPVIIKNEVILIDYAVIDQVTLPKPVVQVDKSLVALESANMTKEVS